MIVSVIIVSAKIADSIADFFAKNAAELLVEILVKYQAG